MADKGEADLSKLGAKPTAEQVSEFHTFADTDSRDEAIHHTLGPGRHQAAPGDHSHLGSLLRGYTISGSRASDTWRLSVNAILVALGASDSSSP
jgi:hypothetical protein